MFLTQTELAQLTGRSRKDKQRQWLMARGFNFEVTADGRPVVLRSVVEGRMGAAIARRGEPNWRALSGQKAA